MLFAILLAVSGNGYGACRFAPSVIVYSEGFDSGNPLPNGWVSTRPSGFSSTSQWHNSTGMCGNMWVNTVACSEYRGGNVYEILESPQINIPPIPPGQDLWLRFNYGISNPYGVGNYLIAMISVLVNGNWSPYTTLVQPISGPYTLGSVVLPIGSYVQNATALKLRFIHNADTSANLMLDSTAVFVDSVLLYIDSVSGPLDTVSSDTTCCSLTYPVEGALHIRPHDYWWNPSEQPYSTDNWVTLCSTCDSVLTYNGSLFINGTVVDSGIYVFPPDSCITITWDTVNLDFGSNDVQFQLNPADPMGCGPIDLYTSVYIWVDSVDTVIPPPPPWCPIEPCIPDLPPIIDTLIAIGGIDIGLCDIVPCDPTDTLFPPPDVPPAYRYGFSMKTIFDPGPPLPPESLQVRMFIYEPAGDTIVDTTVTVITISDISDIVDIDLFIFTNKFQASSNARLQMRFLNAPVVPRFIPLEYASTDDIKVLTDDWHTLSSLGVRSYPYISMLFISQNTGGVEILPGGDRRAVKIDMNGRRIILNGSGTFMLVTVSGRVIMSRYVRGKDVVFFDKLPPGIYIYKFGAVRGRLLIK